MFHITDEGPKKCSAQPGNCPLAKGDNPTLHFDDETKAQQFYEKYMNSKVGVKRLSKPVDPKASHIRATEIRLLEMENDLKMRDHRQGRATLSRQLSEEFSPEEIQDALDVKISAKEAGVVVLKNSSDDPIVGIQYAPDYRAEEEHGLAEIAKALENSELPPQNIEYSEVGGKGVLRIKRESKSASRHDVYNNEKDIKEVHKDLDRKVVVSNPSIRYKYDSYTSEELKARLKERGVTKIPTTKRDMKQALLDLDEGRTGETVRPAAGEILRDESLVIVSDNKVMKSLMQSIRDSNVTGDLRLAPSSNPYSRGMMFYDQRDVGRKPTERRIREEETIKAAKEQAKIKARHKLNREMPEVVKSREPSVGLMKPKIIIAKNDEAEDTKPKKGFWR